MNGSRECSKGILRAFVRIRALTTAAVCSVVGTGIMGECALVYHRDSGCFPVERSDRTGERGEMAAANWLEPPRLPGKIAPLGTGRLAGRAGVEHRPGTEKRALR